MNESRLMVCSLCKKALCTFHWYVTFYRYMVADFSSCWLY